MQTSIRLDGALYFPTSDLLVEDGDGLLRNFQGRELNGLVAAEAIEVYDPIGQTLGIRERIDLLLKASSINDNKALRWTASLLRRPGGLGAGGVIVALPFSPATVAPWIAIETFPDLG